MKQPLPNSTPSQYCHLCGEGPSTPIPGFTELTRVTSDCKTWPAGGQLFLCRGCGTIHKNTDEVWLDEIKRIYLNYDIYHLSGGVEQPVYVPETGALTSRSQSLLDQLKKAVKLAPSGRVLEIGCGNGSFLRTFSQDFLGWTLVGTEFNDKYKARVESIPNVEKVHIGPVEELEGTFHLETMIHVLEHIPWPGQLLGQLRAKLESQGHLLIDLPHHGLNPYDLVVADHCTHFTENSVREFLKRSGFQVEISTTEWIRKELIIVARAHHDSREPQTPPLESALHQVQAAIQYLHQVIRSAVELRGPGLLGVFGTSIAGTWLHGAIQGDFDFWVEEDPNRLGRDYLGKPIYSPAAVPEGSKVLIALAPELSGRLREKCRSARPQTQWFVPEDWTF